MLKIIWYENHTIITWCIVFQVSNKYVYGVVPMCQLMNYVTIAVMIFMKDNQIQNTFLIYI